MSWTDPAGRRWPVLVGLAASAASLLHAAPPYDIALSLAAKGTITKGLHPLTHLGVATPSGHVAKLDFRFVVPLLLRPVHGSPAVAAVLFAGCGVAVYACFAAQLRDADVPARTATLALVGLALTSAGSVFFITLGSFDALAIALAVVACRVRQPLLAAALALAALYTDERAIVALLAAVTAATYMQQRRALNPRLLTIVAVAYGVTRLALDAATDLRTVSDGTGPAVIFDNAHRWPLAFLLGLGCWWLIAAIGIRAAAAEHRARVAAVVVVGIVATLFVYDVTRSLAYLLPLAPVVVVALQRRWAAATLDRALLAGAVGAALTPVVVFIGAPFTFTPLVLQLPRWLGLT